MEKGKGSCKESTEIRRELSRAEEFELSVVSRNVNRAGFFIAKSVTNLGFANSYVAAGHPLWLFEFFVNESSPLIVC